MLVNPWLVISPLLDLPPDTSDVGFRIIKRWAEQVVGNYFVFTSNVDGHFERSGFAPLPKITMLFRPLPGI
jgi:hypothetical protein